MIINVLIIYLFPYSIVIFKNITFNWRRWSTTLKVLEPRFAIRKALTTPNSTFIYLGSYSLLKMLSLGQYVWKVADKRKIHDAPRQPRTCSHPIYTRTLQGVCQVIRIFSPCFFHVFTLIGVLIAKRPWVLILQRSASHGLYSCGLLYSCR